MKRLYCGLSDAAAFRRVEDHLGLILAVSRLGELAWRRRDLDRFAGLHAELLELGRQSKSSGVITGATARLAHARLEEGRLDEAEQLANCGDLRATLCRPVASATPGRASGGDSMCERHQRTTCCVDGG